jgi:hypothetical protein
MTAGWLVADNLVAGNNDDAAARATKIKVILLQMVVSIITFVGCWL